MIVAESPRQHECLRVVVASLLEVDVDVVPWVELAPGDDDAWQAAWAAVTGWLVDRGWWLEWDELEPGVPLEPGIGPPVYWIAAVQHDAWEGLGHALLMHGDDVVLYPPTGTADPSFDELLLVGTGRLLPLDPAALELVRQVAEPELPAAYVFRAGRHLEHLVDADDEARTACGLELAGVQLVLAGAHRRCRWCELSGRGRLVDLHELEAAA